VLAGRLTGGAALKTPVRKGAFSNCGLLRDFGKIAKYGL